MNRVLNPSDDSTTSEPGSNFLHMRQSTNFFFAMGRRNYTHAHPSTTYRLSIVMLSYSLI